MKKLKFKIREIDGIPYLIPADTYTLNEMKDSYGYDASIYQTHDSFWTVAEMLPYISKMDYRLIVILP